MRRGEADGDRTAHALTRATVASQNAGDALALQGVPAIQSGFFMGTLLRCSVA